MTDSKIKKPAGLNDTRFRVDPINLASELKKGNMKAEKGKSIKEDDIIVADTLQEGVSIKVYDNDRER